MKAFKSTAQTVMELATAGHCLNMAIALLCESAIEDHTHDYETYIRLAKEAIARAENKETEV